MSRFLQTGVNKDHRMKNKNQIKRPSSISVLLVEDNEHDRMAFERSLRNSDADFEISVCERAEDALVELEAGENSLDVVVVDYDLPGMTGMDLYRRLQNAKNLPPFLMLTGAGSEHLAVEALKSGMYDYIIKDPGLGYLGLLPLKLADVVQRKRERRARRKAQSDLKKAHEELEGRIADRTAELSLTVNALEEEIAEHQQARKQISIAYDALNSAASGIILTDINLRVRFANPACLRIFKLDTSSHIIGKNAAVLFSADEFPNLNPAEPFLAESTGKPQEIAVRRADGTSITVEVGCSEITDIENASVGKMLSLLDITERKQTETALRESEERLRQLSRKILYAQENERKLVAQEIHDSISGGLAAIKICLEEKLHKMKGDPPDGSFPLEKIISMMGDTIQETRRISARLRPSLLDDLGLFPTFDWFCREFEKQYPAVRVFHRLEIEETDVTEPFKVVIYRILQEAMNNVAKHSEADRVQINLSKTGGELKLNVQDNGCGIDFAKSTLNSDPMSGYGLSNMRDRAEICGGKLKITSKAGNGTIVQLTLPADAL